MVMDKDQIVFEDKAEQFGFTQIPNVVLTSTVLNPTEVRIYAILRRYASMPNGAMPAVATICLEANISNATYKRAIKTFIRSSHNPKPKIPLITSVQRPNDTSVYKIHKITDQLTELLKPAIAMSKKERDEFRKSFREKKRKKERVQNEPSIKNTREAQNEPSRVGLKINPLGGSKRTPSNIDISNIDNNIQEKKDVVVVLKNKIKEKLGQKIGDRIAIELVTTFEKHGKRIDRIVASLAYVIEQCQKAFDQTLSIKEAHAILAAIFENDADFNEVLNNTVAYFKQKGESVANPVGVLINAMEKGFRYAPVKQKTKREWRPYDVVDPTVLLIEQRMKEIEAERKAQVSQKEGEFS